MLLFHRDLNLVKSVIERKEIGLVMLFHLDSNVDNEERPVPHIVMVTVNYDDSHLVVLVSVVNAVIVS